MITQMIEKIVAKIEKLSELFGSISSWIILVLIFSTVYEVFSRYMLNSPTIWSFEISYMAVGCIILLGSALTLKQGAHIRIDLFYSNLPQRKKNLINIFGYLILYIPLGLWLTYQLFLYAYEAFQTGEQSGESAWNPIIWPYRLVFSLGIFLLTLQSIAEVIKNIATLKMTSSNS